MKTIIKKELSKNINLSTDSKTKINKKLDDLKNIECDKQEEVSKLTFKLKI
ncbi:hypothetical protein [Flavobacterium ginsengiterrae]|uniref:Uncharacterized protein n=1 Tax=Flavobacterium ginsengiterrae TaxID=871695 RepID=A0ABP7GMV9_9FLAO